MATRDWILGGMLGAACCSLPSSAATLTHYTSAEHREVIILTGAITAGDLDRVGAIVGEVNAGGIMVSGIRLNSPGGSLLEGVRLAAAIKDAKLATVVARGTICASACFIILAAGAEKYVSYGARVGVHGASIKNDAGSVDSDEGTVAMAKVVRDLGVPPGIIGQMVVTPSDQMVWLSPSDLQSMGVQMTGQPGESAEPAAIPFDLAAPTPQASKQAP